MITERELTEVASARFEPPLFRLSLHGLTGEITAPRILRRTGGLMLGAYPEAEPDAIADFTISVARNGRQRRSWVITSEHFTRHTNRGVEDAARWAEWAFISEALKHWDQFIHVHAGLVATSTQSALLIGRSGSGKSTTTTALALAGLQLYSDDVALVHRKDLRVICVPRPVKLDADARRRLRPHGLRIPKGTWLGESISRPVVPGLPPVEEPGPAVTTAIFFAEARESTPRLRPLTGAEAVMRLVQQSVSETLDTSGPSTGALTLINSIQCFELAAGDLCSTVSVIRDLLD